MINVYKQILIMYSYISSQSSSVHMINLKLLKDCMLEYNVDKIISGNVMFFYR